MLCSICKRDADQVIRVDDWQVCQPCISNKLLEHAIEVRSRIRQLTAAVSGTQITHQRDLKRTKEADDRLRVAHAELEAAIRNLAGISEESQRSLAVSLAAVDTLKDYREKEGEGTRRAHG